MFDYYPPLMFDSSPDGFFDFILLLESQFMPDINMECMPGKIIVRRKRIDRSFPEIDALILVS